MSSELPMWDDLDVDVARLSLPDLRERRRVLTKREGQVSYWRRIIQARLDLLREGSLGRGVTVEGLERVLTRHLGGNQRLGLLSVQPQDAGPMADMDQLWSRGLPSESGLAESADRTSGLEADLSAAEQRLSAMRAKLHHQIDAATAEMIQRYRADPALVLTALPQREVKPAPL